jgi:phytoene synthase
MAEPPLSDCGRIARAQDPDRFLCALFAPAERRETLFVLAALNHELSRARQVASNPLIALMRITWWRETAEEAEAGRAPRRHEVAGPLHAEIAAGRILAEDVAALCDAWAAEAEEGFPTLEAFRAWLRGTSGRLAVMAGRALGAPPAALPMLEAAGGLYGLAGALAGRKALPASEDPETLARRLASEASGEAAQPTAALPREALPAVLPVVLARRDLRRLSGGRDVPRPRPLGDRLAVAWAALRGRV